ncbi:putative membrane protein [Bacillus methanolicus MGA3]|uniref:Putative membrane protein n=1 Tax=Bacillus methanolicus (strain MGA3 / ATCC 53907) TaxID=796606 RepID=A0A068LTF0_BACMM|nr:putative membrane protein [Bacillus methanolicus MGA3]
MMVKRRILFGQFLQFSIIMQLFTMSFLSSSVLLSICRGWDLSLSHYKPGHSNLFGWYEELYQILPQDLESLQFHCSKYTSRRI